MFASKTAKIKININFCLIKNKNKYSKTITKFI